MWRAGCRFGAGVSFGLFVAVASLGCGGARGAAVLENRGSSAGLIGGYWCRIEDSGFKYDRFACVIRRVGAHDVLAKLGGSQRFEGEITPGGEGFESSGRFYCAFGDCTQQLHGEFARQPSGTWLGRFTDAKLTVELSRAPDNAFGGATYGGDGYGGFGYGGVDDGRIERK